MQQEERLVGDDEPRQMRSTKLTALSIEHNTARKENQKKVRKRN